MKRKKVLKDFIKYVSQNIIGMIGLSCYILADTYFISSALGADGLTALNFCISVFSILQGIGLMLGIGGATRFSILKNTGERENANKVFTHAIAAGAGFAVLFVLIGIFFSAPLLRILGADAVTMPLANVYLIVILCFSPFFLGNNILLAFVRNDNNPRLSMTAMLISSFSNIALDYIFMFPLSMGIFGAAFATGLSPVISLGILSFHFIRKKNNFKLNKCKIKISKIGELMSLGASSFVGELSSSIALITFNLIILDIEGNVGVAAYGVIANIAIVAVAVFNGIAQGMQPLVSIGHGTKNSHMLKSILRYSVITAFLVAAMINIGLFYFGEEVVAIFNKENNIRLAMLSGMGMQIYFTGFFFAGINIVAAAYFSAKENARTALVISLLRSCIILVPMVIVLGSFIGMNGVWLSFVFTEIIVCILSVWFCFHKTK